jgi:hypothetical protein
VYLILVGLTVLIFTVAPGVPAQSCEAPGGLEDRWNSDVRNYSSLADRIGDPETIRHGTEEVGEAEGELASITDMHALFEVPISAFEQVIRDINAHEEFVPRMAESEVVCADGSPASYAVVRHDLSFKFLFFGNDYSYRVHYFIEDNVEERELFRTWWALEESLDGQMADISGSWLFKAVRLEGREYTYVRYSTRTVFAETVFGLKAAFERFGARDIAKMMGAMRDEAARRTSGLSVDNQVVDYVNDAVREEGRVEGRVAGKP